MFFITQNGSNISPLWKQYVCDAATDLTNLPKGGEIAIGSEAIIIATGETYKLNSQKQWVKWSVSNGSITQVVVDGGTETTT